MKIKPTPPKSVTDPGTVSLGDAAIRVEDDAADDNKKKDPKKNEKPAKQS